MDTFYTQTNMFYKQMDAFCTQMGTFHNTHGRVHSHMDGYTLQGCFPFPHLMCYSFSSAIASKEAECWLMILGRTIGRISKNGQHRLGVWPRKASRCWGLPSTPGSVALLSPFPSLVLGVPWCIRSVSSRTFVCTTIGQLLFLMENANQKHLHIPFLSPKSAFLVLLTPTHNRNQW